MNFYFLFLFSFFLLACGGAFHNSPPAVYPPTGYPPGGQAPTGPVVPPGTTTGPSETSSSAPPSEWGVVKCNASQYNHFNQELRKFLSTTTNINNLNVDCRGQKNTKGGMFLKGSVEWEDGKSFNPSSHTQNLKATHSSYLEIHIVPIIGSPRVLKMRAVRFGGEINKQSITLAFQDDKGEVFLNGGVQNNIFSGTFEYRNATGPKGSIGTFSISACHFLKCQ